MSSTNRFSVSVSAATGKRIDAHCRRTGDSQAELIDKAVLPVLDGDIHLSQVFKTSPMPVTPTPVDPPETLREFKKQMKAKAGKKPRIEGRKHPAGTLCASCTREVGGQPYREMEHNGGIVALCVKCSDEPVRERDHLLGSHRGGIGDGNRRTRSR